MVTPYIRKQHMKLFVHRDLLQSVNKAPDLPIKRTRVNENSDGCSSKGYGLTLLEEPFMGCESGLLAAEDVDICSEGVCSDDQEPDNASEQRPDVIDECESSGKCRSRYDYVL